MLKCLKAFLLPLIDWVFTAHFMLAYLPYGVLVQEKRLVESAFFTSQSLTGGKAQYNPLLFEE